MDNRKQNVTFLALPQKSNQKKSRQNEATAHKANAGPPFCLASADCLSKFGANFEPPIPRPSEEKNGLAKIAKVFEGRFPAVALASDARAGVGLCDGAACIVWGNRPVENKQFLRSLDLLLLLGQAKSK